MSIVKRLLSGPSNVDCLAAADMIEQQAAHIKELEAYNQTRTDEMVAATRRIKELEAERDHWKFLATDYHKKVTTIHEKLISLRQRIADAPVVAWLHEVRRDSDVITDQVRHLWGRVPVAVGKEAHYTIPLISKEDLQK